MLCGKNYFTIESNNILTWKLVGALRKRENAENYIALTREKIVVRITDGILRFVSAPANFHNTVVGSAK